MPCAGVASTAAKSEACARVRWGLRQGIRACADTADITPPKAPLIFTNAVATGCCAYQQASCLSCMHPTASRALASRHTLRLPPFRASDAGARLHGQHDHDGHQALQAAPRRGEHAPVALVPAVRRELRRRARGLAQQRALLAKPGPVVLARPAARPRSALAAPLSRGGPARTSRGVSFQLCD